MVLLRPQKTHHKSNVLEKGGDSWTDHVRNEEVLHRVKKKKKKKNILHAIKIRKAHFIGHILRRNRQQNTLLKKREE
jgi:hypothetical protein